MDQVTTRKQQRRSDPHAWFQNWFAWIFLGAAALTGLWIFFGPQPEDPVMRLAAMFFVELPLFVVLALIGMNALVRRGMGGKQVRRRRG